MCHEVLDELGVDDPMLEVAMRLEEAALQDDYFVQRKLYPNVDFYSGIIYKALGIPTEMFTVMFAIARTAGWVAHWLEQQEDPEFKIGRPRQIYTGPDARDYVPVARPCVFRAPLSLKRQPPPIAGRFRLLLLPTEADFFFF